jgi:hypothetical protein
VFVDSSEVVAAATQAYIYGYPLCYNLDEIAKLPGGESTIFDNTPVPWNGFAPVRELLGPSAEFVSPNNDTLYLIAPLDLSAGPLVLHVPDTHDRYYVLQFVDAWTNNFAYIGRRATGTAEADYLLVLAGYTGDVPVEMTAVEVPSTVAVIVGRVAVNGESDLPAVHDLQDQFTLRPLDANQGPLDGIPTPDPGVSQELAFWEQLRVGIAAFPPPEGDSEFMGLLETLGVVGAASSLSDPDPQLAAALAAGAQQGRAMIDKLAGGSNDNKRWSTAKHMFDYNLDRLGLGTLDSPEWLIADRKTAYVTRAVIARAGLWGNNGYEANYDLAWVDADGDPLDGTKSYEVTFSPPPPVQAFWSLTMYDTPRFYLVANPINRYSIGDRTPGLVYGEDGSVTLYLQHEPPTADKQPNWLPTPAGPFRPVLRSYQPDQSILDDSYQLPEIRRLP